MHLHVPKPVHGWKQFFNEIAVIAIGILIAIGLEQIIESVHHRRLVSEFEDRMGETFHVNQKIQDSTLGTLAAVRSYLSELQLAVAARRDGRTVALPSGPTVTYLTLPTLGPYQAAQENGTLGLLEGNRIRLYKRLEFQHSLTQGDLEDFRNAMRDIRAFRLRSNPQPLYSGLFFRYEAPDLTALSDAELAEYQALIAAGLQSIDELVVRMNRVELQAEAIARGATDEADLVNAVAKSRQKR